MNPDETKVVNHNPRFHRGQIVVREWGSGAKEYYLVQEHYKEHWYLAYGIQDGNMHEVYLDDNKGDISKYSSTCRLMDISDGC